MMEPLFAGEEEHAMVEVLVVRFVGAADGAYVGFRTDTIQSSIICMLWSLSFTARGSRFPCSLDAFSPYSIDAEPQ